VLGSEIERGFKMKTRFKTINFDFEDTMLESAVLSKDEAVAKAFCEIENNEQGTVFFVTENMFATSYSNYGSADYGDSDRQYHYSQRGLVVTIYYHVENRG
jgi:hypothetical protein